VPKDKACTQIYGGPEDGQHYTHLAGPGGDQQIRSQRRLSDQPLKLMKGLLPPGGT
jgi:hypothetical protein